MVEPIYFDHSATTPLDPRVAQAMEPWLGANFGNPSSLHWAGRQAREAVELARCQVAALLNAQPNEIIFTASGTEADNLALSGVIEALGPGDHHLITSAIEHPAILNTCRYLERRGVGVTYLPVNGEGLVKPTDLIQALRPTTRLVSIMAANNVVGTLQPVTELGRIARTRGVLFHTDAVQAAGKIPFDMQAQPIDLLSMSAHKLHGPKGIGLLYVREGVPLAPLIHGGGQERGLRSATENVAGIVGLGLAAELARVEMADEAARLVHLRDRLIDQVTATIPNAYLVGHRYLRLPGHICLGFAGQEGEAIKLLLALDAAGIAISTGSACSAHHATEPSYILRALGFDPLQARGSLRITLGRFNTDAEVDRFLEVLPPLLGELRPITSRRWAIA
ncbi:MAG TPA: cysteine desulfurase family protein [Thiobacillaceae bacterium]|nr:cysteine desulfurase family protein [Thiobacillaceae bacterium]